MISDREIREQSLNAYDQWCEQWRSNAKIHSDFDMKSLDDFKNIGIGKAVLCIANGYSLEENIEKIKENQDKVDIFCCDKTLGHLLDNGITPAYCLVCDANVDYEKYMKPWEDQLQDIILFNNVCGNTKWSRNGNWKDIYFFANKDILNSEKEFMKISGCPNVIPAATNVSNAMVVFLTQSDNNGRRNFFGYDKILLIGYDFSWQRGKYYAFDATGEGKDNYMRHVYGKNIAGELCFTSNNLAFSSRWLAMYVGSFDLPVIQCSKNSIFSTKYIGDLESNMDYNFNRKDSLRVNNLSSRKEEIIREMNLIDNDLRNINKQHRMAFLASV